MTYEYIVADTDSPSDVSRKRCLAGSSIGFGGEQDSDLQPEEAYKFITPALSTSGFCKLHEAEQNRLTSV